MADFNDLNTDEIKFLTLSIIIYFSRLTLIHWNVFVCVEWGSGVIWPNAVQRIWLLLLFEEISHFLKPVFSPYFKRSIQLFT